MPDRPNIVLLIAHDLGCHIGPYGWAPDHSHHLLGLAQQSMRFDSHFATSPGCSQSRSSLVTGRYPHANGQFGLAHLGWKLHEDESLLPDLLRTRDYQSVLFGIWHLHAWTLSSFDMVSDDVSTADSSPEGFAEVAGSRAAQWIGEHGDRRQPFYMHVGFWEVHRPFCGTAGGQLEKDSNDGPAVAIPSYLPDTDSARREIAELRQSVSEVDRAVGKIVTALDERGLSENTIVLFTADHGLPFPRAKGTLYDPGIQIALLVRWPGQVAPGSSCAALTSNVDVVPTLLHAAGISIPQRVQGCSFLNHLRQESRIGRDAIYAEKTYHEHYDPIRCVRTDEFKLIRNFASRPRLVMPSDIYNSPTRASIVDDESLWGLRPEIELYNLRDDPAEQRNLAADGRHGDILQDLSTQLHDWMQCTEDPLLNGPVARPAP